MSVAIRRAARSRRRLVRLAGLAGIGVVALLAGCFTGRLPARELYRLAPSDSLVSGAVGGAMSPANGGSEAGAGAVLPGTLGIMAVETPGLYGEGGIVYRIGEAEYGVYPSREWAIPLGDMLGALTARLAARQRLTRELPLFDPPSPRAQTWLWRARVREFEEVNRGSELLVAVRIEATLVRASDDSVVWSGTAARERAVTGGSDMRAVVGALSDVAAGVVTELLAAAERDLARRAPPAAEAARRAP